MIDTREKRASAIGAGLLWRVVLPAPDGALSAADRQQAIALYRAIAAAQTEPPPAAATAQQPVGRLLDIAEPVGRLI